MPETLPTPVLPLDYASTDPGAEVRAVLKVMLRLIPLMCFLYLFNYLDRVNISYAKLLIPKTYPWFDDAVYALGTSVFFIGYFLFEVPSNLIMEKVGARVWMARIMITWGIISTLMAFISLPWHFYTLRLTLGLAEAGFFPGMLLYITYWVPAKQRAKATALFMTSTALSGVIGGLLAELLMRVEGFGLVGWQWLLILEGVPSVLLGFAIFFFLPDRPHQAKWLTSTEKDALLARLEQDRLAMPKGSGHLFSHALADIRVWILCLLYGALIFGFYVNNYWTPSLVKGTLAKDSTAPVGVLSAIPFFIAVLAMSVVGWWADRSGKRKLAVIVFALVGAAGYALAALANDTLTMVLALSLAAGGIWSTLGPFWALPSRFLHGTAAAAGIGLINSIGNLLGGFIGPNMMGQIKENYHTYTPGLWISAGVSVLAALVAGLLVRDTHSPDGATDTAEPRAFEVLPIVTQPAN